MLLGFKEPNMSRYFPITCSSTASSAPSRSNARQWLTGTSNAVRTWRQAGSRRCTKIEGAHDVPFPTLLEPTIRKTMHVRDDWAGPEVSHKCDTFSCGA